MERARKTVDFEQKYNDLIERIEKKLEFCTDKERQLLTEILKDELNTER